MYHKNRLLSRVFKKNKNVIINNVIRHSHFEKKSQVVHIVVQAALHSATQSLGGGPRRGTPALAR